MQTAQSHDRYQLHGPIRHPSRDVTKKRFLDVLVHQVYNKHIFYAALKLANFDLKLTSFEPHTNAKPAFLLFRQVMFAVIFFRIGASVISLGQKTKDKNAGFPFVDAWTTPC